MAAILLAPILALQAQRLVDEYRERRRRRTAVFAELMATRLSRVSPRHFEALNAIEMAFCSLDWRGRVSRSRRDEAVVNAWHVYRDHLNQPAGASEGEIHVWASRRDELFSKVLLTMSKALGYPFNEVEMRRGAYSPQAHGDLEQELAEIRRGFVQIFRGEKAFPTLCLTPRNPRGKKEPPSGKKDSEG